MPIYEVRGPDAARKYWLVEVESEGAFLSEAARAGSYSKKERAQAAADKLNKPMRRSEPHHLRYS